MAYPRPSSSPRKVRPMWRDSRYLKTLLLINLDVWFYGSTTTSLLKIKRFDDWFCVFFFYFPRDEQIKNTLKKINILAFFFFKRPSFPTRARRLSPKRTMPSSVPLTRRTCSVHTFCPLCVSNSMTRKDIKHFLKRLYAIFKYFTYSKNCIDLCL